MIPEPRALLRSMFDAAVAAAQPAGCLLPHLPEPPAGRTVVIGAGKAATGMAQVLDAQWPGPLEGLVVAPHGQGGLAGRIEVVEAAHPVPDRAGLMAAERVLGLVSGLNADDLVICLLSGGASALLPMPLPGLTLGDKQTLAHRLLACGASISEINCVRRHLSAFKGGRLGAACHPARVVTLAISDVPGDVPEDIASGPTVADPSTVADARAVLARYGIEPEPPVRAVLASPAAESVKPGDPALAGAEFRLVATPQMALEAAAEVARAAGYAVAILGDSLEGEARELGRVLAGIARQVAVHGQPLAAPCVLLSGGESSVTVRGHGRGGRNVECLLALGLALHGRAGVHALMADTDGVDGVVAHAGAWLSPDSLARARALGIDPLARLADNDAHGFFEALGDALVTGPTGTNVDDFRAVLVTG